MGIFAKTLVFPCSFLLTFLCIKLIKPHVNSVTERKRRQNFLWLLLLFPCLFVLGLDWLWGCRRACLILAFFPQHSFISLLPSAVTALFKMTWPAEQFAFILRVLQESPGWGVWPHGRFSSLTLDYLLSVEFIHFPSKVTIRYDLLNDKLLGVKIHFLPDKVEFYFTSYNLRKIV